MRKPDFHLRKSRAKICDSAGWTCFKYRTSCRTPITRRTCTAGENFENRRTNMENRRTFWIPNFMNRRLLGIVERYQYWSLISTIVDFYRNFRDMLFFLACGAHKFTPIRGISVKKAPLKKSGNNKRELSYQGGLSYHSKWPKLFSRLRRDCQ